MHFLGAVAAGLQGALGFSLPPGHRTANARKTGWHARSSLFHLPAAGTVTAPSPPVQPTAEPVRHVICLYNFLSSLDILTSILLGHQAQSACVVAAKLYRPMAKSRPSSLAAALRPTTSGQRLDPSQELAHCLGRWNQRRIFLQSTELSYDTCVPPTPRTERTERPAWAHLTICELSGCVGVCHSTARLSLGFLVTRDSSI